jgi:hypothetical protein
MDNLANLHLQGEDVSIIEVRQSAEAYNRILQQQVDIENEIYNLKIKEIELNDQIYKQEMEMRRALQTKITTIQDNAELRRYEALGDWESYHARRVAIENEKLSGFSLQSISQQEQLARQQDVQIGFYDELKKMYLQGLKTINPYEADRMTMIEQYRKINGGDLDINQMSMIEQILSLQRGLENLPKIDLSSAQIQTNDLTSRGGWSGGSVETNVGRINQVIAGNTQNIYALLGRINWTIQNGLVI